MEQLDKEELELMNKLNEIKMKKKNFEKINKNKQIIMGLIDENKSLEELLIEEIPYECIIKSSNPYEYEEQELLFKLGEARRKMRLYNKIEENKRRIKSIEEDIEENEEDIIIPNIIKKEEVKPKGNMDNLQNAKLIPREELEKLTFNSICESVLTETIKEGDFIQVYTGKGWNSSTQYGRVKRISDKTIFFNVCRKTDNNLVLSYEWKPQGNYIERAYYYYYFDINKTDFLETTETKILKKSYNKISKVNDNFILMKEFDYGA